MKRGIAICTLLLAGAMSVHAQTVSTLVDLNRGSFGDGLVVAPSGDLFLSGGFDKSTVLKITPQGEVSDFATGLQGAVGAFFDSNQSLYVNSYSGNFLYKVSGNGQTSIFATGLNGPAGVVLNSDNEIFVSEFGANFSGTGSSIKKISTNGDVDVYANGGGLRDAIGIALDDSANIYASNWQSGQIFKITPERTITLFATIPGGTVNQMTYANGNLYVPSPSSQKVYTLSLDGALELLAGTGQAGSQNGPALQATFRRPNSIAASVTGDTLYVLDADPGIIRMIILDVTTGINDSSPRVPESIHLGQNYPNPFNPETTITFDLPKSAFVSLKVYDLLGREVKTLVAEQRVAGAHLVSFSADGLASGLYTYRIEAGDLAVAKKMLLLK